MAEVVRKSVGLELGSKKNWGQGLLESEGGACLILTFNPGNMSAILSVPKESKMPSL